MSNYVRILIATLVVAPASGSAQGALEIVASTDDEIPGGNGTFLSFDGAPLLNSSGHAAFLSTLAGTNNSNDTGALFRGRPGELIEIAREGDDPTEGNGSLGTLEFMSLNGRGEVSFVSLLTGTTNASSEGIYRGAGGSLTTISRDGNAAPDGNGTFATFFSGAVLNAHGQVAFQSFLNDTLVPPGDDSGLFRSDGMTVVQIVREGDPVPNSNETFGNFFVSRMAINVAGQVAFPAQVIGPDESDFALFRGGAGVPTQIARSGQTVPDGNGVLNFDIPPAPLLNDSGQAAFTARLTDTDGGSNDNAGIFLGNGMTLKQMVRKGQAAPDAFGTNGSFQSFDGLAFNAAGQVAFTARLTGTSGGNFDNSGVFLSAGSNVMAAARKGEQAPAEFAIGELFPDGTFSSFGFFALNAVGQIAFDAQLSGSSDGTLNNRGIFLFDPIRGLLPVVRKGDAILDSTISQLLFADGTDSIGNRQSHSGLNDSGQVAFQFTLTNGRQGIAIFTPSFEPVTGDYNNDGIVNAADYTVWRENFGTTVELPNDSLGGEIGFLHYDQWKANYGTFGGSGFIPVASVTVPEPMAGYLFVMALASLPAIRYVRR